MGKFFRKKTDTAAGTGRRMSRAKKILVVFLVLILTGVAVFYKIRENLNGPAVGTVVQSLPSNEREQGVELEQFEGKLFTFAHPVTFVEQSQKPIAGQLESHTFIGTQVTTNVLVTTVTNLPSGNPDDDASYKMRQQNPDKYKMKPIVVKNEKVVIFSSDENGQLQQAAFWVHQGKLLTFALSGATPDKALTMSEFEQMVQLINWR